MVTSTVARSSVAGNGNEVSQPVWGFTKPQSLQVHSSTEYINVSLGIVCLISSVFTLLSALSLRILFGSAEESVKYTEVNLVHTSCYTKQRSIKDPNFIMVQLCSNLSESFKI